MPYTWRDLISRKYVGPSHWFEEVMLAIGAASTPEDREKVTARIADLRRRHCIAEPEAVKLRKLLNQKFRPKR